MSPRKKVRRERHPISRTGGSTGARNKRIHAELLQSGDIPDALRDLLDWNGKDNARCPFAEVRHERGTDRRPSFSVKGKDGACYCHACGYKCSSVVGLYQDVRGVAYVDALRELWGELIEPLVPEGEVRDAHRELLRNDLMLGRLEKRRGIKSETVERFQLGWRGERIWIPIRNEHGYCVDVRRYDMMGRHDAKVISYRKGHGAARLFPIDSLNRSDTVVLVEGEMDAMVGCQEGLAALTVTSGAKTFPTKLAPAFGDKQVIVIPDNDKAGREGAERRVRSLAQVGASVRLTTLPVKKKGEDLTDWLLRYGGRAADLLEMDGQDYGLVHAAERAPDTGQTLPDSKRLPTYDDWLYVIAPKAFVCVADPSTKLDRAQFADYYRRNPAFAKGFIDGYEGQTVYGMTFQPMADRLIEDDGKLCLNAWRPGGVEPEKGGVGPFLKHMNYLVPKKAYRQHVLDWLAHVAQRRGEKIMHALLIWGKQGIGKSYLSRVMEAVLGLHNVRAVNSDAVKAGRNTWMEGSELVVVEEMMAMGRQEMMNTLKSLITEPRVEINPKYVHEYQIPNRVNFMFFSNHSDALKLEDGDRRYMVVHCPGAPKSEEYYRKLFRWTERNGPALAHYLSSRDLSAFNPHAHAPRTAAKRAMLEENRPALEQYIKMKVDAREVPFDREIVSTSDLIQSLTEGGPFTPREATASAVGRALSRLGRIKKQVRFENKARKTFWAIRRPRYWKNRPEGEWRAAARRPRGI